MLEPDDLARLMGLCDWRVGAHRFAENQVLWAHSLWLVEVQPSFHDHWVIAGVAAEDWRPNAPVWRKAVMAQGRATAVIEVDRDPVAEVLNAVPLLPTSMGERLDGIGYHVRTETVSLRAEFWFANPHVPQHVALERALRELGERIAAANQASGLAAAVTVWRQYTEGR